MLVRSVPELCATVLNMTSNVVMLIRMCQDPSQKVPRTVLAMQVLANVFWFSFAYTQTDVYLMTTTGSSATLQCLSVYMLSRVTPRVRRRIREDISTDTLIPSITSHRIQPT